LERAQKAVLKKLRDPESARFRNVRSVGDQGVLGEVICGEVNAKNAMGGYVGFRKFHYSEKVDGGKALIPGSHGLTEDPLDTWAAPSDRARADDRSMVVSAPEVAVMPRHLDQPAGHGTRTDGRCEDRA
jgi:hypothetical protein